MTSSSVGAAYSVLAIGEDAVLRSLFLGGWFSTYSSAVTGLTPSPRYGVARRALPPQVLTSVSPSLEDVESVGGADNTPPA